MNDTPVTVAWQRLDAAGHDTAQLRTAGNGWRIEGVAVFVDDGKGCCMRYTVDTDSHWQTVSAGVTGWTGDRRVELHLAVDAKRQWMLNGVAAPAAAGCIDVDLSFTPATNLLPLRRLALPVGASQAVPAAWLTFPGLSLERLEQTYSRTGDLQYDYESSGGAFRTTLTCLPSGFVSEYPGLWSLAAGGTLPARKRV